MNKLIILFFLFGLILSCTDKKNSTPLSNQDNIVIQRLNFIFDLKKQVALDFWTEFNTNNLNSTINYKANNHSYILNPNKKAKELQHTKIKFNKITLIKTDSLIGGRSYSMTVSVTSGDIYKNNINYEFPIVFCSDVEKTKLIIPDVSTTEMWSTMVIHELFHLYQRNLGFDGKENEIRHLLKDYFIKTPNFKEMVVSENKLLIEIIQNDTIDYLKIRTYLKIRKQRMEGMPDNLKQTELVLEKVEGTGRYIEAKAMLSIGKLKPNQALSLIDTMYNKGKNFKHFDISSEKYLTYAGSKSSYFYATGYNLLLLLDKLNIEYKKTIFDDFKTPIYKYLEDYLKTNSNI